MNKSTGNFLLSKQVAVPQKTSKEVYAHAGCVYESVDYTCIHAIQREICTETMRAEQYCRHTEHRQTVSTDNWQHMHLMTVMAIFFTYLLLYGSRLLTLFKTLISSLAASRYLSMFLMIFSATVTGRFSLPHILHIQTDRQTDRQTSLVLLSQVGLVSHTYYTYRQTDRHLDKEHNMPCHAVNSQLTGLCDQDINQYQHILTFTQTINRQSQQTLSDLTTLQCMAKNNSTPKL